jgi:uncharacterized iron-regulated membrane protein
MFRKTIFWIHLVCGVLAGSVVFTMSFTGVALTYQRQITDWAAQSRYVPQKEQGQRLPLDQLLLIQQTRQPQTTATTLVLTNDPGAPVSFRAGRQGGVSLNPYTGAGMDLSSPALAAFFSWNTGFHRWFNIEGENRAIARQVTGVSNVVFLFLIVSGMYLWLPKIWHWALFRGRLLFRASYPDSKARDFHWHHIFGIWAALPLFAVVYTGAVISYPWAANLLYATFGAEVAAVPAAPLAAVAGNAPGQAQARVQAGAQQQQGAAANVGIAAQQAGSAGDTARVTNAATPARLPLDTLVARAIAESPDDWKRLNVTLPTESDAIARIEVDRGNGAQAHKRHTLSLERSTGAIVAVQTFADTPESQRLRGIARFLHTGEVLGFWGQTLAGLVSFAALFMVWTGFALSWRRLIVPLYKK